jgi:ATP adenylyltransferase/5',5'''-P-1,P-4-tetraphosphate phosphorylase II
VHKVASKLIEQFRSQCRASGEALAALAEAARAHAGLIDGDTPASFNFLMTDRWMLTVPRRTESDGALGINGMGFSGCFFVRGEAELEYARRTDPMKILEAVGQPW